MNKYIPSTFSSECKIRVCTELMLKIFHAQVNEYMSAVEEIQLEKEGKTDSMALPFTLIGAMK